MQLDIMPKKNPDPLEQLALEASNLAEEIFGAAETYSTNTRLVGELRQLHSLAQTISEKLPRLKKLRDWHGYRFAIIDPTSGEVRAASDDEAYRLLMDYQRGDVLSIVRNWTVENGAWKRITPEE